MLKFKVFGNYAPNLKGKPGSCYLVSGLSKPVVLDLGFGTLKGLLNYVDNLGVLINNMIIILSHNHVDHSYDVIKLIKILKNRKARINIYLPKKSIMFYFLKLFKKYYNVHVINSSLNFKIDDVEFSFCKTPHRGESYAIKLKSKDCLFVYTSDISYVSYELSKFIEDSDFVLVDIGKPGKKKYISLKGYHGNLNEIVSSLVKARVGKIYATHLKAFIKDDEYLREFPKGVSIELVKIKNEYLISKK